MARRVLITGARAAAALDIARDFVAAGWKVHLADSVRSRLARWSSLPAMHHFYPPPRHQAQAFGERITDLVRDHVIDLIVPTCEEVFYLAAPGLHAKLGERLFAPDIGCLRMLHDKLSFACAVQNWGLEAPQSMAIETAQDLEKLKLTSREWVFKPRFSRFGEATLVAPDRRGLEASGCAAGDQWMAQRYIRGDEACFHAVAHRGRLTAFAGYASTWRLRGGACYAFEPVEPERAETLRFMAQTIVQSGDLHGQFGFDVIFDEHGKAHLLECNPRATSGVHLIAESGRLAGAIAEGNPIAKQSSVPSYLAPAMWFFGLPKALSMGRLREWKSCLTRGSDAISLPDDRLPLAGAVVDTACFASKGIRHKISANAATTYDIEWNGEELVQ